MAVAIFDSGSSCRRCRCGAGHSPDRTGLWLALRVFLFRPAWVLSGCWYGYASTIRSIVIRELLQQKSHLSAPVRMRLQSL